jgi:hypothetical protein
LSLPPAAASSMLTESLRPRLTTNNILCTGFSLSGKWSGRFWLVRIPNVVSDATRCAMTTIVVHARPKERPCQSQGNGRFKFCECVDTRSHHSFFCPWTPFFEPFVHASSRETAGNTREFADAPPSLDKTDHAGQILSMDRHMVHLPCTCPWAAHRLFQRVQNDSAVNG